MESNLAARLKDALSAAEWDLLQRIAGIASELGLPLYAVGGLPRDVLLGIPHGDFDLVTEGRAEHLAQVLVQRYGGRMTVHSKFATAKWWLRDSSLHSEDSDPNGPRPIPHTLDFVSARSETYKHPAALPTITLGTIADDLRRRDFSINAIAVRLDGSRFGEVRDNVGGWQDLQSRTIRVLHGDSFSDDPTRMYRAVRYEQRYRFEIDQDTLALVAPARELVGKLSPQRIRHELDLILDEEHAGAMLSQLEALALLKAVDAALVWNPSTETRLSSYQPPASLGLPAWPPRELRWILWLMQLPAAELDALGRRLHFTAALLKALQAAAALASDVDAHSERTPSQWVDRLDAVPLVAAFAVSLGVQSGPGKEALRQYLAEWRHVRPRTTGHVLKELGVRPGFEYQSILHELRDAWLDGTVRNEAEERARLQALLHRA